MPGGVKSRRRRHARKPGVIYNIQGGLDVFADNRSGCIRRQQVWMYSPTTGLDVFANHRSGCIRRQQVTPRRRGVCTGRRGRQGPHPRARKVEVTRARDPLLGPRRTSSPLTLIRAGARRPPRLTGAARNARAHAGQHRSARRVSARAQCRGHPRPLSDPGAAPHFAAVPTRPRRRQGVATAHGRRAQRAGTCRAALERPARACMDFFSKFLFLSTSLIGNTS